MRILQMSDIHLEFEFFLPKVEADVLMLNGDICVADYFTKSRESKYWIKGERQREFFQYCADNYEHVIYIMGNHEHYSGTFTKTADIIRQNIPSDVHFLDNEYVDIDGIRFIGTTLWTDLNRGNPITEQALKGMMTDFRIIKHKYNDGWGKFSPAKSRTEHFVALEYINRYSADQQRVVVMTHHAPSQLSIHPKYQNDDHMNGGYYSDLSEFILDRPQIELWTHGHMHDCFDYEIGNTRVLCNPKGYNDENKFFKPNRIIEI